MIKGLTRFLFTIFFSVYSCYNFAEINSWECDALEGAKIISGDGEYLGDLGPSWQSESIYNSSSEFSSSWSQKSIYNQSSDYGSSYSNQSAFNEGAGDPPKIINKNGELVGLLSIGPSWDNDRKHPEDIRYTCDWD